MNDLPYTCKETECNLLASDGADSIHGPLKDLSGGRGSQNTKFCTNLRLQLFKTVLSYRPEVFRIGYYLRYNFNFWYQYSNLDFIFKTPWGGGA
jgi:hypothetical protein